MRGDEVGGKMTLECVVIFVYLWASCGLHCQEIQEIEQEDSPKIIVFYAAEYHGTTPEMIDDQCSSYYSQKLVETIDVIEASLVRKCPQNVAVQAERNPSTEITQNKVHFNVAFNITSVSDSNPETSKPLLRECLAALKATFKNISASESSYNLKRITGSETCEEISLNPSSFQVISEIPIPEEPSSEPATSGGQSSYKTAMMQFPSGHFIYIWVFAFNVIQISVGMFS